MDRQTLRDWVHRYNAEGLAGLSNRRAGRGRKPLLTPEQTAAGGRVGAHGPDLATHGVVRWRRHDLRARIDAAVRGAACTSARWASCCAGSAFGGSRCGRGIRSTMPAAQEAYQKNFAAAVAAAIPEHARGKPLEIWFQDEARVGQQGTLTRVWAQARHAGRRRRATALRWAYLFGAVCPARGAGAGPGPAVRQQPRP